LLLFVKGGAHGWRFDYSFHGRRKTLSFGIYPDTSLALARRKADAARQLVAEDIDPSQKRKAEKESFVQARVADAREAQGLPPLDSFEAVAREWFAMKRDGWAASYGDKIIARFEADVFPWIGKVAVGSVTPPQLLGSAAAHRGPRRGCDRAQGAAGLQPSFSLCRGHWQGRQQSRTRPQGRAQAAGHQTLPGHHRPQAIR
jgi:hypothetical protein